MSKGTTSYRIKDENVLYFLTFSTVNWIDVFSYKRYKDILTDSLCYCQDNKGLELYSWCIMSNHIHLVARAAYGFKMSSILRDMKKFTSKKVIETLESSNDSRKNWILAEMRKAGLQNSKTQKFQLWRNDNHPIKLFSNYMIDQKIEYIHNNPVKEGIVEVQEEYLYSSAKYLATGKGLLKVCET